MVDEREFQQRLQQLRDGDQAAAAWLVANFEPELRRVIRLRLTDSFLRRLVDSSDICQSVMANFFVRVALGQYELEEPKNLISLLVTMARNKVINLGRDRKKERLARQATTGQTPIEDSPAPLDSSGEYDVEGLLQKARALLSPDEIGLVEDRLAAKPWSEIAAARNETPDKCRKQYRRALDRVAEQLGLTEPS